MYIYIMTQFLSQDEYRRKLDVHLHNDTVFVTRRIQEKVGEQQYPLHICFFETKKAHDAVNRNIIWPLLLKCGLPLV